MTSLPPEIDLVVELVLTGKCPAVTEELRADESSIQTAHPDSAMPYGDTVRSKTATDRMQSKK